MAEDITLLTVLQHIQALKADMYQRFDALDAKLSRRIDTLDGKFNSLGDRIDRTEAKLVRMIDGLDNRLDSIEITMKEQKHEARIMRLETHAGLAR